MNTTKFFKNIFLLALVATFLVACSDEEIIPSSELPSSIKDYVSTHFPANEIIQVVKDRDGFSKSYDVILAGSISLEFNKKNNITEISSISQLPDSVIPEKIRQHTATNFPDNVIIGWELDDRNQQVKLNNGLELEFTKSGDFLRIDN
ncbi:MAG TPA: hypothetical protein DHV26_17815 [Cytophagales bacterium]|nr:hypothetical protein [Cytophagales bacterium]HRG07652.1 PepSY-like domain-containing protein [Cyclobacteriaceae bacterium]